MRLNSLRARLVAALLSAVAFGMSTAALALSPAVADWVLAWGRDDGLSATAVALIAGATTVLAAAAIAIAWSGRVLAPLHRLTRSLETVTLAYRDGDFGVAMPAGGAAELADLAQRHRALGDALREQRQHLAQRELMLDTVVLNTPVALVLVDAQGRVAYANIAARQLLGGGRSLESAGFGPLMSTLPDALQRAVRAGEDTLLSLELEGQAESLHVSRRAFRLQGRPHTLHLFRHMTRELSRQEVASWKRVIRVISHELNNSLAPISSMAHSGAELLRRGDDERAAAVFASIGQRARHLHGFLGAYADFAKLPTPRLVAVDWPAFVESLAGHAAFRLDGPLPGEPGRFDPSQLEQALINLLKNAHEADGDPAEVTLRIGQTAQDQRIEVGDRGRGMSEAVLAQALLPFYSTKRSGTGLGLALAREIAEAHGGRISLANRDGGGLRVTLNLPRRRAAQAGGEERGGEAGPDGGLSASAS